MGSILGGLMRRLKYGKPIVLVSGLPRSGTSMAMKMLSAGGMETIVDNIRTADEDNPKGYFEDERVKELAEMDDTTWIRAARGKVIKVVSSLLQYLPKDNSYKVIFMRRNLHEVLASQAKMLERRGEENTADDDDMLRMYRSSSGQSRVPAQIPGLVRCPLSRVFRGRRRSREGRGADQRVSWRPHGCREDGLTGRSESLSEPGGVVPPPSPMEPIRSGIATSHLRVGDVLFAV